MNSVSKNALNLKINGREERETGGNGLIDMKRSSLKGDYYKIPICH